MKAAELSVRTNGTLGETSLAELLAEAYNHAFSGRLELELDSERASAVVSRIELLNGSVCGANGPWLTPELAEESFAGLLPPDLLQLAREHASEYALDTFAAVERLKLLPANGLRAARESCVVHGIRQLSAAAAGRFRFVPEADDGAASPLWVEALEPLNLIVTSLLSGARSERSEQLVAAFADGELSIDPVGARSLLATLSGPARPVVEALLRAPSSVAELRQRSPHAGAAVTSALYALWLTHHLRVRARDHAAPSPVGSSPPPSSASGTRQAVTLRSSAGAEPSPYPPRPPSTGSLRAPLASQMVPRGTSSSSVRIPAQSTAPATVSSSPPVASSVPPFAAEAPAEWLARQEAVKERKLEDKVVEAWSLLQADPASLERVASFIRKAASLFPRNTRMRFFSACLREREGDVAAAVSELERVLSLDPRHDDARRELRRLRSSQLPPSVGDRLKRLFGK